ncbi:MAG: carboxymuconolactone decarboxylase [Bacteroidetes bacterium]|nr:carboxymuconolactone decarboxylase [Bacteroidota bacterium]
MKSKTSIGLIVILSFLQLSLYAQKNIDSNNELSKKQQCIITISAHTAKGNLQELNLAINEGLDAGLTVNEVKEILVQLYAYTGFPRSLNALNTCMEVLKEREQNGIKDVIGRESNILFNGKSKLEFGTEVQTQLIGKPNTGAVYSFTPIIDVFLKEHLFADIFGRDILDYRSREIVTISALASLSGTEPQLQGHLMIGKNIGLTKEQIRGIAFTLKTKIGSQEGNVVNKILEQLFTETATNNLIQNNEASADCNHALTDAIFPKGSKVANQNFTGTVWLYMMVTDSIYNTAIGNVTFEPGARTNWHYHPGGQILLITNGVGYYQEKGHPIELLHKGDIVKCSPNIEHWHGASPSCGVTHIAISTNVQKGNVVWLQPVSNEEYNSIKK